MHLWIRQRDRLMGMVEQSNALLEDLRKDREELRSDRDKDREVMAELDSFLAASRSFM